MMKEEKKVDNIEEQNAMNLDLSETARRNIWVNGDCTKVIRLNLTDFGVIVRAKDAESKLQELQAEANELASAEVPDSIESKEDEKKLDNAIELFRSVDKKMREIVDDIFDYPVCEVCCDGGSMYDIINGQYRYDYIIDKIMVLYDKEWAKEKKIRMEQMKRHTAKYTKSRKRK